MPVVAATPAALREPGGLFRARAQRKWVLCLLLVAVTLALYNPVARNGFVNYDDDRYVTDNPHLRSGIGLNTISWAFTSLDQANWHPLTWLSHALDYRIFRLGPAGHHDTSVLLHVANTLLLFLILQWFTGYTGRSLMVAVLFAVHPINVESVAWVAERKNVLCMFFFLLAVAAYGWYLRRPGVGRYALVTILFAMGLMSKPMAVTLPLVLLLLDYWPFRRMRFSGMVDPHVEASSARNEGIGYSHARFFVETRPVGKLFLEKIPLLLLSVASATITMIAQRAGGAVLTSAAHAPFLRLENVVVCYVRYIEKAIWPAHLAVLYPYPHALPAWQAAASAIFLVSVTWAVLKYRARRPYLLIGWLWYLLTMFPMIGLIQVGNQAMADRYTYLPFIGLFILTVWAIAEWAARRQVSTRSLTIAGVAIVFSLAAVTRIQIRYWHDDLSLWSHALAVTKNNYVAENNFAHALTKQGRPDEAIVHFRAASDLEPDDPVSELNLGIYAQEHGDLQQAVARYDLVLQLATDTDLRATAYANLGTVYFALHDFDRAQCRFDAAIQLKRVFPIVLLDMGLIAQNAATKAASGNNDWNRAANYFEQYVSADPTDVGYFLLANALQQSNRGSEAKLAYQQALKLSNDIDKTRQRAAHLAGQPSPPGPDLR